MGIEALTHDTAGKAVCPRSDGEWVDWVSAGSTRNWALDDPLLDWLDLHGQGQGFVRDDSTQEYDPRTDFSQFIFGKGREFERALLRYWESRHDVCTVGTERGSSRSLACAENTFAAMKAGRELVYQAVLMDAASQTYGVADFLVRSDVLRSDFPSVITASEAAIGAPDIDGTKWHYRVVDAKYTTLHFRAGGDLNETEGSTWAYMLQVYVYNRALGRLQGYLPPVSYLLGRGWQQTVGGENLRCTSCLERLGVVPQDCVSATKGPLAAEVDRACDWARHVRKQGDSWQAVPHPGVPELYPNMKNTSDQPWHSAKQSIAEQLGELTMLWQVGVSGRWSAHRAGVSRWTDPGCSPAVVGVTGPRRASTLDAILDVNRPGSLLSIRPARIRAEEATWRQERPLEFYVDFETVSDLDDDFSTFPEKGGQPLIFMIGCGYLEQGRWNWRSFVADDLTLDAEARIIDDWFAHMEGVRERRDPGGPSPIVFHWSPAEQSSFETAFNSACERHPEKKWVAPAWFDFLKSVVKAEPVTVKGALGFGLKAVGNAMHGLGFVPTKWETGPTDGLGAMVGAWWSGREARTRGCWLRDVDLMKEIERYNEVDCKVMMEVVRHLRRNN